MTPSKGRSSSYNKNDVTTKKNFLSIYYDNFPVLDYLKAKYPGGTLTTTNNYVCECPVCKRNKFWFSIKKYKGLCFHCWNAGRDMGFGNLENLIMFTENINFPEAVAKIKMAAVGENDDSFGLELNAIKRMIEFNGEDLDVELEIREPIPFKITPDMDRVVEYLNSRKRPMSPSVLEIVPAYFSKAPFLRDRMIFQIDCNDNYGWLAYYIGDDPIIKKDRKTLNPRGGILSQMVLGYDLYKKSRKPLLVVEGIFDFFRAMLRGYNVVCTFGNKISASQISLINDMETEEVVLCYDGDKAGWGTFKGTTGMWGTLHKWGSQFNAPLSFMELPWGNDPDSCGKRDFRNAFESRRRIR
jgi:hypothetical protein